MKNIKIEMLNKNKLTIDIYCILKFKNITG